MDNATCIPSRVLRLPPPLLRTAQHQQRGQRWTAVLPSPDRSALLLRRPHECQLVSLAAFAGPGCDTADTHAPATRVRPLDDASPSSSMPACASTGIPARVVLPQPHRVLTASCWLSAGMDATHSAVIALGDECASLTVMRSAPAPHAATATATASSAGAWAQTTIFLHDDTTDSEDLADLFAHRARSDAEATAAGRRRRRLESTTSAAVSPSAAAAWKAVTAVVPCNYVTAPQLCTVAQASPAAPSQPRIAAQPPVEAHLLCQRAGDGAYAGGGVAGAGRASARATLWMAAVQRASAWRVPLALPPGEAAVMDAEESTAWGEPAGAAAIATTGALRLGITTELLRCKPEGTQMHDDGAALGMRHALHCRAPRPRSTSSPVRLLDVRRRPATVVGPMGLVVAAAMRRHVGLYTTAGTSVTPTVFLPLPADPGPHPPSGARRRCSWRVASVLEAPAVVPTANGFSYLVTLTARGTPAGNAAVPSMKAEGAEEGGDGGAAPRGVRTATGERRWLLYDCRNPSAPVWAADAPCDVWAGGGGHVDVDVDADDEKARVRWGDVPMHAEWLSSAGPGLCAAYVPDHSAAAANAAGCGGTCVVLDGGTQLRHAAGGGALDVRDSDTDDADAVDEGGASCAAVHSTHGGEVRLPAPITYALSPPRSAVRVAGGVGGAGVGASAVVSAPVCVRALAYWDGVLHYACDDASV